MLFLKESGQPKQVEPPDGIGEKHLPVHVVLADSKKQKRANDPAEFPNGPAGRGLVS
jgi:hypothetical protein